jgi:hypothetical protein
VNNVRQMVDSCGVTVADDSDFDRCHLDRVVVKRVERPGASDGDKQAPSWRRPLCSSVQQQSHSASLLCVTPVSDVMISAPETPDIGTERTRSSACAISGSGLSSIV